MAGFFLTNHLRAALAAQSIRKPPNMKASELVYRVAETTGLPYSTVYSVKRRFVETGVWPSSRGTNVPSLGSYHLVMLLLALLADVPAKDAAASASAYYSLADPDGNKLGECLENIINSFRSVNPVSQVAAKSRLEVYTNHPRACIYAHCKDGIVETSYGLQSDQWSELSVRRSTVISGKCLFDLAMHLHFGSWPEASVVA
jgi:hypothetical protein